MVYKIYANILNKRLVKEAKEKLKEVQFSFRKNRGTIDAIYTMNYVVNKELSKKEGKIFAFFADVKAVFDKVDRRQLNEMIRKRIRIEDNLRRRIQGNKEYSEDKREKILDGERS